MRILATILLLIVGCIAGAFSIWLFYELGGTYNPAYIGKALLATWWLFIGPLFLILGPLILIFRPASVLGAVLIFLGCLELSGFVIYNSAVGLHSKPLQAPPDYLFYVVLLAMMLIADVLGYKAVKLVMSSFLRKI